MIKVNCFVAVLEGFAFVLLKFVIMDVCFVLFFKVMNLFGFFLEVLFQKNNTKWRLDHNWFFLPLSYSYCRP